MVAFFPIYLFPFLFFCFICFFFFFSFYVLPPTSWPFPGQITFGKLEFALKTSGFWIRKHILGPNWRILCQMKTDQGTPLFSQAQTAFLLLWYKSYPDKTHTKRTPLKKSAFPPSFDFGERLSVKRGEREERARKKEKSQFCLWAQKSQKRSEIFEKNLQEIWRTVNCDSIENEDGEGEDALYR